MDKSHYTLSWDAFYKSMCVGFSLLQQNEELVDLTLAADGYLVKVHQVVLSIASPYIKELIRSADCKHPVIFMNNISYKTLCSLLEYVYTGEASVGEDDLPMFLETAKILQIRGLDGKPRKNENVQGDSTAKSQISQPVKKFRMDLLPNKGTKLTEELQLPAVASNVNLKRKHSTSELQSDPSKKDKRLSIITPTKKNASSPTDLEDTIVESSDDDAGQDFDMSDCEDIPPSNDDPLTSPVQSSAVELQYTVSNQGSLQLILNRYIYGLISRKPGLIKRWLCVDNRHHKCPAAVVTENNVVVQRTKLHNHPFHDKRIAAKVEKKAVFSAIRAARDAKDAQS